MLIHRGLNQLLSDVARMGYDAEWRSFFAIEAGFPTYRKRVFIIAYPISLGCESIIVENINLQADISEQPKNTTLNLPLPLIRFHSGSDFDNVHLDNGFSKQLDKDSIKELGNAIVPQIAYEIFKAIEATQQLF